MEVDIPQHTELMWSVLESLKAMGGSGTISEINNFVITHGQFTEATQHPSQRRSANQAILIVLKFSWDHLSGGRVVTEFRFWPPLEIGGSVRQLF